MELSKLEGFYWVAVCGGYARAAREFPYPITQPGVFQQVKKLEAELEVTLFERVAKDELALTPAGRHLFDFCRPFFESWPALVRDLRAERFGGEVRIGAGGLILRHLMPPWIQRLRKHRADIRIQLDEAWQWDTNLSTLRRGELDMVVDFVPALPPDMKQLRVATAYSFLVYPAELGERVSLDMVAEHPFISYPPETPQHDVQMAFLSQRGQTPHSLLAASSVDSILAIVRAGLGYSVVPWLDPKGPRVAGVRTRLQRGRAKEFPVCAIWLDGRFPSPLVKAVLECAPQPA